MKNPQVRPLIPNLVYRTHTEIPPFHSHSKGFRTSEPAMVLEMCNEDKGRQKGKKNMFFKF